MSVRMGIVCAISSCLGGFAAAWLFFLRIPRVLRPH